jgi:hypothetical protein
VQSTGSLIHGRKRVITGSVMSIFALVPLAVDDTFVIQFANNNTTNAVSTVAEANMYMHAILVQAV